MEYESAFDQALARPLLQEPVKKRWTTWWDAQVPTKKNNGSKNDEININYRHYDGVGDSNDRDLTEVPVVEIEFHRDFLVMEMMEEGSLGEDLDVAMMRERHQGIQDVHSSMMELNAIQKELAAVVEWQSDEINVLEENIVDTVRHTDTAVSHLQALQQAAVERQRRRQQRWKTALVALVGTAAAVCWIRAYYRHSEIHGSSPETNHIP